MMELFAYNLAGNDEELIIWVGIRGISIQLDTSFASRISFKIANDSVKPRKNPAPKFEPLGDTNSQNYRAIFIFNWPNISTRFNIEISCDGKTAKLTSKRPPKYLPKQGEDSFKFLLSSCYYQPNDKTPEHLGTILGKHIKPPPDFTYLAGDQVYLDLPSLQNLPKDKNKLAQALEAKYRTNWFPDQLDQSEQPNLSYLLKCGPVLCIPDDHEYWNNFPYKQAQLNNTYSKADRENWKELADLLYQRYQMTPGQQDGFFRMDIKPLYMLFIDSRRFRDKGNRMFNEYSIEAIKQWSANLLAIKENNSPVVGLLSSGQALLMEKSNLPSRYLLDAEMPNFQDYETLISELSKLINAGIPIIYITGDVHWGRIVEGKNSAGNIMFYEIIASPSRLQDFIFKDQFNWLENKVIGSKESKDFPTHPSPPEKLPNTKLANLNFCIKYEQRGDHVALLNFNAAPGGIALTVDYICTDKDKDKRNTYSKTIDLGKILNPN